MTAIAYKDGVLAADTLLVSCNGARAGSASKIGRTDRGWLWAFSGEMQWMGACVESLLKPDTDPPEIKNSTFILIDPSGVVQEWWGCGWARVEADHHAWGSGERVCRGAMFAGATAAKAVEAAIAIDLECGGYVMTMELAVPAPDENDFDEIAMIEPAPTQEEAMRGRLGLT